MGLSSTASRSGSPPLTVEGKAARISLKVVAEVAAVAAAVEAAAVVVEEAEVAAAATV